MIEIKKKLTKMFWKICSVFPINENKVVVSCFEGKGYFDSPKYLANSLYTLNNQLQIICLINEDKIKKQLPCYIIPVKNTFIMRTYHLSTSKVWIDNCRKCHYISKRSGQYYVQTWHGGLGLKKTEKDVENSLSEAYVKWAIEDSKNIDIMLSNSKFLTDLYKRVFWYSGKILELGLPRNDIFFCSSKVASIERNIKEIFGLDKNAKILLYAPTFRKENSLKAYDIDYSTLIKTLEKKYSTKWYVIIRLHPNIQKLSNQMKFSDKIINGSYFPDGQELLIAADMLITDYSSIMFDYSLLKKPCVLYANDIDDFNDDRGFYFDLKKLPFPLAKNNKELFDIIIDFNQKKYNELLNDFENENQIVPSENSSCQIAQWLMTNVLVK